MKNIKLRKDDQYLIIDYMPLNSTDFISESVYLDKKSIDLLKNRITIDSNDIVYIDDELVSISIAEIKGSYYVIKNRVFSLKHTFYFNKDLSFNLNMFLYSYGDIKESILKTLDEHIDDDFYVEDDIFDELKLNHIPIREYLKLIDFFPKKAEIYKYIGSRINFILEEYLIDSKKKIDAFEKVIKRKNDRIKKIRSSSGISIKSEFDVLFEYKIDTLKTVREWLSYAIDNANEFGEEDFQKQILFVIQSIFPKYLYAVEKVSFDGFDYHDKIPDYVLIGSNGEIDILEIKKPDSKIMRDSRYRDNYSPSSELSGAAIQVEKYINCLQRNAYSFEKNPPERIQKKIPQGFDLHVINPRGMILIGSSNNLEDQQRIDFEIIRRHYIHITDIITYDDLLKRIDNIIECNS